MKNLYFRLRQLLVLIAITSWFTASAATITSFPYTETNFKSNGWTAYKNGKGSWTVSSLSSCQSSVGSGISDAWLFSPEIQVKASYKYTFSFTFSADRSSYPVSIGDFYILPSASNKATPIKQFDRVTTSADNMSVKCVLEYDADEDASVYFAIADMTNGSNKGWYTTVKDLTISEEANTRQPTPVSGLNYTTSGDNGTTVSLSWTNPTLDTFGDAVTIKGIRIKANDEEIVTLTDAASIGVGASVTYTDPTPRSGFVNYSVSVIAADDTESKPASVATSYIGPFVGLDVPMELPFKDSPFNPLWTLSNTPETTTAWTIDETNDCMSVSVGTTSAIDATAASPAFNLSADKAYRLTYTEKVTNKSNEIDYSVSLIGESTTVLRESAICDANPAKTVSFDFTPATSGQYSFSWHATAEKMTASYYNNTMSISGIMVEEIPVIPTLATRLTATAAADGEAKVGLQWTNPAKSSTGIALTGLTATIVRDGMDVATMPVEAGATSTYTDRPDVSGYHTYSVKITNANGASPEAPMKVTADFVGAPLAIPFTADFLNKPQEWCVTEYGENANGNLFQFHATQNWAYVEEKATEFAEILASAPVSLKSGRTYKFSTECSTSSSSITAELLLVKSLDQLNEADGAKVIGQNSFGSSYNNKLSQEFYVDEPGDYIFAIRVVPSSYGSSDYTFYVKALTVEESATVPAAATDVTAKSDLVEDGKVALSFTMPDKSVNGMSLNAELSANIYHAGGTEAVAEVKGQPGETVTWTHTEATTGLNQYDVEVTLPDTETHGTGGTSEKVSAESDWCGRGHGVPFESNFADETHRGLWTIADQSGTYTSYKFEWDDTAQAFVVIDGTKTSTNSNLDDWLITPPLYIVDEATYTISMEVKAYGGTSTYSDYSPVYSIYIGNSSKPADFINKGTSIVRKEKLNKEEEYATYTHSFSLTPQAEQGAHAASRADADEYNISKKFMAFRFGEKYTTAYPYVEVRKISIGTNISTGIESVSTDTDKPSISYDGTTIASSASDADIEVYTIAGALVVKGRGSVAADTLPAGIYIARCDGATLKFRK